MDPSGHDVIINGTNLNDLGELSYLQLIKLATSDEFQAYIAFRNLDSKALHMARTMEADKSHKIYIESSKDASLYLEHHQNGNDHTITFNPGTFFDYPGGEAAWPLLYGAIDWYILDTHVNLDYLDAIKETLIHDLISLSKKADTITNVAEFIWTSKTESPAVAVIEAIIAYTPFSGMYTLLGNLIGQQDFYDAGMILSGTPYPFK